MLQFIPDELEDLKYQIGISSSLAAVAKLKKLGVIPPQVVMYQTQTGQFITNGDARQREWVFEITNCDLKRQMGRQYQPYAFTEQGVALKLIYRTRRATIRHSVQF